MLSFLPQRPSCCTLYDLKKFNYHYKQLFNLMTVEEKKWESWEMQPTSSSQTHYVVHTCFSSVNVSQRHPHSLFSLFLLAILLLLSVFDFISWCLSVSTMTLKIRTNVHLTKLWKVWHVLFCWQEMWRWRAECDTIWAHRPISSQNKRTWSALSETMEALGRLFPV